MIDPLISECDVKEAKILKEFGETDAKDFNYNICCSIFRQFISQVQREQNVKISFSFSFYVLDNNFSLSFHILGTRETQFGKEKRNKSCEEIEFE